MNRLPSQPYTRSALLERLKTDYWFYMSMRRVYRESDEQVPGYFHWLAGATWAGMMVAKLDASEDAYIKGMN